MIDQRALGPLEFCKYHALGNDYLVVDGPHLGPGLTPETMVALCHRHRGIGSDGVLVLDARPKGAANVAASLRIFNPDGSEAEKSGNGLRIFARALFDLGYVKGSDMVVELGGAQVPMRLTWGQSAATDLGAAPQVAAVTVGMGRPVFASEAVAMDCPSQDTTTLSLEVLGQAYDVTCVSMGNPHCVVFVDRPSVALLRDIGPLIERHPMFLRRTNVQLVRVVDRTTIELYIWERGAGETSASGSSSCAAVAAVQARGLCDDTVTVQCPGGTLTVHKNKDGALELSGPATFVCRGHFAQDLIQS